ncbi:hypothetical protein [Enterococcus plantarum]|uniref:hypothetical protein n=1 Tax=Enterococcus plantarum TaxID=1077675 RepID=UPI001A8E530F|nr:hypothetical protein [Enterococcus plantarum]MBO0423407.1 hypothetical protein [Enterococcus plantarum]
MNTNEKIKNEAIKRMRQLDLYEEAINKFIQSGTVFKSERTNLSILGIGSSVIGTIYELSNEQKKCISDFEKEYDSMVYHVIETNTEFGLVNDLLYVSNNTDQWEMEQEDLSYKTPCVYCVNTTYPDYSEFGSIAIQSSGGGLIRVG